MRTVAYGSQTSQAQHVMAAIKWREHQKIFSIALLLIFGVPMTFFGPIAMTSIYWLIAAILGFVWPWQWLTADARRTLERRIAGHRS